MTQPMFRGDLEFLSNYAVTPLYVHELGVTVRSGEHAFNAFKTTDPFERETVLNALTPGESKKRGRRVSLRPGWNTGVRVWAMQRVVWSKFSTGSLAVQLENTGEVPLVETNTWHDQFWGDCLCSKHAATPGQNMLGELLMTVRAHHRLTGITA